MSQEKQVLSRKKNKVLCDIEAETFVGHKMHVHKYPESLASKMASVSSQEACSSKLLPSKEERPRYSYRPKYLEWKNEYHRLLAFVKSYGPRRKKKNMQKKKMIGRSMCHFEINSLLNIHFMCMLIC